MSSSDTSDEEIAGSDESCNSEDEDCEVMNESTAATVQREKASKAYDLRNITSKLKQGYNG